MCVSQIWLTATVIDRIGDLPLKTQAKTYRDINKQMMKTLHENEKLIWIVAYLSNTAIKIIILNTYCISIT